MMPKTLLAALVIIACWPSYALAAEPECKHGEKTIPVGGSIWIDDPELAAKGLDWQGFRLTCIRQASPADPNGKPGSVIKLGSPVLVLSEYSRDYYYHVIENQQTNTSEIKD